MNIKTKDLEFGKKNLIWYIGVGGELNPGIKKTGVLKYLGRR